jgi:hypothetical protein
MSSPGGEETGEGERQNELHPLPDCTKPMTDRKSWSNTRPDPGPSLCWLLYNSSEDGKCEKVMSAEKVRRTSRVIRSSLATFDGFGLSAKTAFRVDDW